MQVNDLKKLYEDTLDRLWDRKTSIGRTYGAEALRVGWSASREIVAGELTLRAMSLVYTTLLSLVPLLALSFSLLKALGVHNRIEPMLLNLLDPLGQEAPRIAATLIGFVDNMKIGVLGSVGIAMLFYTVLAMIQKVEASFNHIWHIARTRPLTQRITEYLVVLLLGPLAMSLIFGMTASLNNGQIVERLLGGDLGGLVIYWIGRILPWVMIAGTFTFMFMFIPNTRVRVGPALAGGVVSGVLWQSAAWGFARFVASASNYNAVYSSFAILIFLLIWLYLGWLILLIGCQISFFVQNPEYVTRHRRIRHPNPSTRQQVVLQMITVIAERFERGLEPLVAGDLVRRLRAPPDLAYPLINELTETHILVETAEGGLLLQQDPATLTVRQMLDRLHDHSSQNLRVSPSVDDLSRRLNQARDDVLGDLTVAQLLAAPATARDGDTTDTIRG